MRPTTPRLRFAFLLAVLAAGTPLLGGVVAHAYFSASGQATGSASVGTLTPPGSPTAQMSGSSVQVSWNAATLSSGGSAQGYRVIRSDAVTVCGSPTPVSGLLCTDSAPSLGSTYTYTVTAVYATFSASATTAQITVLVAPTISSKPSDPSASTSPSFSFSGGGGTSYSCRLDAGSWQACTSGVSYTALTGGSHTFSVHAVKGGATGADASYTWTVNATAPSITSSPPNPSANTTATFTYQHPQNTYTFQCKLDAGSWSSCSNVGTSFNSLADGSHTFQVRALSADGASTASASYSWTIDTTAPTITAHPANPSTSPSPSFSFSHVRATYTFSCQIDGGGWSSCASPKSYSLSDGSHTFAVCAIDSASFATAPASFTWLIDTTGPTDTVTLAAGAAGASLSGTTLYFKSDSPGSFKFTDTVSDVGSGPASATFPALSATNWTTHTAETIAGASPYTSSTFIWSASALAPGNYTITSKDAAGNQSAGKTIAFVADITGPTGGALTVNGTAASSGGTTSTTTSTNFTIAARTDYTDSASGILSSVLTVRSATLTSNVCGAPGSGGPFTSATTIAGTTQPNGITAGYCYTYALTGTDKVTNTSTISTTVKVNAVPSVGAVVFVPSMSAVNVTVSGSGFVSGTTFSDSDPDVTVNSTTYVSSTQLTVNVTTNSAANPGTGNITVTNPDASTATCANCSYLIAQVSSGNGMSANSISTSPSFTLSAGVTYILLADDQVTTAGNTATPSAPGGWATPPTFTAIGTQESYNNGTAHEWAWLVNGGAGSGTFQVTFSKQMSYGYLGVLALPGTVRSANVGYGESGCAGNLSTCTSTTLTNPATAQLPGTPQAGAAQLILWSDAQNATPTVASPFTGMYFNIASQSSANGSTQIYAGPASASVVSLNQGLNTNWGTLALEIDP